jgi:hypothetical protein
VCGDQDSDFTTEHLFEMEGNITRLCVWTEQYLLAVLKTHLKRAGRPIPDDLQSEEYD